MFEYGLKRTAENQVTVQLCGALVLGEPTEHFRSCLQVLTDRYSIIVLDANGLHRVDSAGLGELVRAHSDAQRSGGVVRMIGAGAGVRDLLVLTKLVTVFGADAAQGKQEATQ